MEKLDVTDIEVVDILAKGQKAITAEINAEVENAFIPGVDNLVYLGLVTAFEKNQDKVDWVKFFELIEEFLHDPQYSLYSEIIKSHVLDVLASSAAHNGIDPHYLSFYAGPGAREHFKSWERINNNQDIFRADRHLNAIDVAEFLSEVHPTLYKNMHEYALEFWHPEAEGIIFFGVGSKVSSIQHELDWQEFFNRIEQTLTDPRFFKYSDTICTHVIEGISNVSVSKDSPIKEKYIKKYIGPKTKEHWVAWEQFNGGPHIF